MHNGRAQNAPKQQQALDRATYKCTQAYRSVSVTSTGSFLSGGCAGQTPDNPTISAAFKESATMSRTKKICAKPIRCHVLMWKLINLTLGQRFQCDKQRWTDIDNAPKNGSNEKPFGRRRKVKRQRHSYRPMGPHRGDWSAADRYQVNRTNRSLTRRAKRSLVCFCFDIETL